LGVFSRGCGTRADNILAQHPPAVKVGGRRLSISSKPKPHTTSEHTPTSPTGTVDHVDYPRPAPPGEDTQGHSPHNEDEAPKKEKKKHGNHDEKKLRDANRKAEATRPTREAAGGGKSGFGAGGRIAQPAGKMFV